MTGKRIVHLAAKGDGVAEDGSHHSMTAPGDVVGTDGGIRPGPHRAVPPCRHFGRCGGCQLQHVDDAALASFVARRIETAMHKAGLRCDRMAPAHLSPPHSRRRASMRFRRTRPGILLGYQQERSNRIIDLAECPVLEPSLATLVDPLRRLIAADASATTGSIRLTAIDGGADCIVEGLGFDGLDRIERLTEFARRHALARLRIERDGEGVDIWEPRPARVSLSGVAVPFPPAAFLQATRDGEAALVRAVEGWLEGSMRVADLFAGLGTFAFALAANGTKVHAVEAARDACGALTAGARSAGLAVAAEHRDLFRAPLRPDELARFDAVILDPPRAGAKAQIEMLARSDVATIAYVSCNPSSWSRDAALLSTAGYRLEEVRPVGQFRWSTHVELASLFRR